jgi:hypothetical protein
VSKVPKIPATMLSRPRAHLQGAEKARTLVVGTRRPPQRGIGDACASVDAITSRVRLALPPPSESLRHCACTPTHGPSLSRLAHVEMAPHAHVENSSIRSGCSRSCSGPRCGPLQPILLRAAVRPVGPWDHWNQCALFPPALFAPFPARASPGALRFGNVRDAGGRHLHGHAVPQILAALCRRYKYQSAWGILTSVCSAGTGPTLRSRLRSC